MRCILIYSGKLLRVSNVFFLLPYIECWKLEALAKCWLKFDSICTAIEKLEFRKYLICSSLKCQNTHHVVSFGSFCTHTHYSGRSWVMSIYFVSHRMCGSYFTTHVHWTIYGMVVTTANICESKPALVFIILAWMRHSMQINKQTKWTNERANKHIAIRSWLKYVPYICFDWR